MLALSGRGKDSHGAPHRTTSRSSCSPALLCASTGVAYSEVGCHATDREATPNERACHRKMEKTGTSNLHQICTLFYRQPEGPMPKPPPAKAVALTNRLRWGLQSLERKMVPPEVALLDFVNECSNSRMSCATCSMTASGGSILGSALQGATVSASFWGQGASGSAGRPRTEVRSPRPPRSRRVPGHGPGASLLSIPGGIGGQNPRRRPQVCARAETRGTRRSVWTTLGVRIPEPLQPGTKRPRMLNRDIT